MTYDLLKSRSWRHLPECLQLFDQDTTPDSHNFVCDQTFSSFAY